MKKARNLVLVVVVTVAMIAPAVAQAQVEPARWGWEGLVERLAGFGESLLAAIAGSQTEDADLADGTSLDGTEQMTTEEDPSTGTNVFPLIDPDG